VQQQNIWHIAKYQDNKNHPKICANGQILQTFIFTFLLGIYNLKPMALFTNSIKKCMDIENGGSVWNSDFQPGGRLLFSRDCKSF